MRESALALTLVFVGSFGMLRRRASRCSSRLFLAEGLKATERDTSTHEVTDTGTWGLHDPKDASAEAGRHETENFVQAAVRFIERWNQLRAMNR